MSATGSESLSAVISLVKGSTSEATILGHIRQAISDPNILVFGELFALENVQKLSQGSADAKKGFKTLELFCYGRYSDFSKNKDEFSNLTDKQSRKLKQLSIVSLANENRVIPYNNLQTELDVPNLRDLEDLVIDAFYRNIVTGKLDHANSQLQVDSAIGRDVRPAEIDSMIRSLRNWEVQAKNLLTLLEKQTSDARKTMAENEAHQVKFNKQLDEMKANVKAALDAESESERAGAGMMHMMGMLGDYGGKGGKGGKKDQKFKGGSRHGY